MKIKTVNKLTNQLKIDWDSLWENADNAHYFNSRGWIEANMTVFPERSYKIFLIYDGDKLVGLLPLVETQKYGIKLLASPMAKFCEKSTLLLLDNSPDLLNKVLEINIIYDIYLQESSEWVAKYISQKMDKSLAIVSSVNPYILLEGSVFEDMSKKQESKIRNRYEKHKSKLELKVVRDISKKFDLIYEIDNKSTKAKQGYNVFAKANFKNLFEKMVEVSPNNFVADVLYFKGNPIVYSVGIVWRDTYQGFLTAYVGRYGGLIPGKLLVYLLLKRLKSEKYKVFDFGRGINTFKKEFTSEFNFQYDVYLTRSAMINRYLKTINFARLTKIKHINDPTYDDHKYLFRTI